MKAKGVVMLDAWEMRLKNTKDREDRGGIDSGSWEENLRKDFLSISVGSRRA